VRELFWTGSGLLHHVTNVLQRTFQALFTKRPPARTGRATWTPAFQFLLGKRVTVDRATGWCTVFELGKAEAEALLDWLEAAGNRSGEARLVDGAFSVRWHRGPLNP
jgi:hypothetical protein